MAHALAPQTPSIGIQPPVKPLNFGNITYIDASGQSVTRGIRVYLLDGNGNDMEMPTEWKLDMTLIRTCEKLANELIKAHLTANPSINAEILTGFDKDGLLATKNPTLLSNTYAHNQDADQKWNEFEKAIMDYFYSTHRAAAVNLSTQLTTYSMIDADLSFHPIDHPQAVDMHEPDLAFTQ